MRPAPDYFANLEELQKQPAVTLSDHLIPLFYLQLLCLPELFWVAPNLLRFIQELPVHLILFSPETQEQVARQLQQHKELKRRLRRLAYYLSMRAASLKQTAQPDFVNQVVALGTDRAAVTELLAEPANREHIAHLTALEAIKENEAEVILHYDTPTIIVGLMMMAMPLFKQSLRLLAQRDLIDYLPATEKDDLLICLRAFPPTPRIPNFSPQDISDANYLSAMPIPADIFL